MEKVYYLAPSHVYRILEKLSEQYHKSLPEMAGETIFSFYHETDSFTATLDNSMEDMTVTPTSHCIKSFPDEHAKGFYFELPDYIFSAVQKKATQNSISADAIYSLAIQEYYRRNNSSLTS